MFLWKNRLRLFVVFFNVIVAVWEGWGQLESKVRAVRTVEKQPQSNTCSQLYASLLMKGCFFTGNFSKLFKTQVSCSFFFVFVFFYDDKAKSTQEEGPWLPRYSSQSESQPAD